MFYTNQIIHGDCLEIMPIIDDGAIDLILCDLPYGITARNTWDKVIDIPTMWRQYERIIKQNGAIILFGIGKFIAKLIMSNEKMFRYTLVWEKTLPTGFLNANKMPMRAHEDIAVFYKKLPTYNPEKTCGHKRKVSSRKPNRSTNYGTDKGNRYDSTERFPGSILRFSNDDRTKTLHPTQKPLDLCRYLIRMYSNAGDVVLDNACRSGTALLAAKLEGRRYIGIDNGYCERGDTQYNGWAWADIARERIKDYGKNNI
jgi:site-specific DNA-methyltransferase (adenine-specific)